MLYDKTGLMTRRRPRGDAEDQYDPNIPVDDILDTVGVLHQISDAIDKELRDQNSFLAEMGHRYQQSINAVNGIVNSVRDLMVSSGMSPMTMTLVFIFLLVLFLWLYWKAKA